MTLYIYRQEKNNSKSFKKFSRLYILINSYKN